MAEDRKEIGVAEMCVESQAIFPRKRPSVLLQQTCKACGQPDKFDFNVPDEIWRAVVPAALQTRAICLYCFDEFAHDNHVDYAGHITQLYFAGRMAVFLFVVDRTTARSSQPLTLWQ
jgi:hypothetical protein